MDGQLADTRDEFVKLRFVLEIVVQMERETYAVGAGGAENADHLVYMALVECVEIDKGMTVEEILVLELVNMGEHRGICHVVAVDRHIVRRREYIAGLPHIHAAVAVFVAIEVPVQVVVLFAGTLQHRVVDIGVLNVEVAYHILVQVVQSFQIQKHAVGAGGICGGVSGRRCGRHSAIAGERVQIGKGAGRAGDGGGPQGHAGPGVGGAYILQMLMLLLAFIGVNGVVDQENGTDQKNQREENNQSPIEFFIQKRAPPVCDVVFAIII